MKINIIGPSGSGKTTLATKLSRKYGTQVTVLDYLLFTHDNNHDRIEVSDEIWRNHLDIVLRKSKWIIEGVNPIKQVMDQADLIIYLRPGLLTSLYRQWKRYLTDSRQRKEHGFINNLKLSQYLIRQYLEKEDINKSDDPKYFRISKMDRLAKEYNFKTHFKITD